MRCFLRLLLCAVLAAALAGCARSSAGDASEVRTLADLKGRTCGVVLGTVLEEVVTKIQPGVVFRTFNDYPSAVEALRLGKIDAIPLDTVVLKRWVANRPDEFRLAERFADNPYGYVFKKGSPLRDDINVVLRRMKESGQLARIVDKWCGAADLSKIPFEPLAADMPFTGSRGTLRFVTTGDYEPGAFIRNGEIVGFDVDVMRVVARALDMKLVLVPVNTSSFVVAVQSGKGDVGGGCITIVDSRRSAIDYSDCYLDDGFSLMVRRARGALAAQTGGPAAWARAFGDSFARTFVVEDRWRLFLHGLGVTLLVTFLSALFGTLLAFPVWRARTSGVRVVAAAARVYVSVLQGTPVLVLLMVLYYIVFGRVAIDGVWVAVVGFSLNASAYVGEMLRGGVAAVPVGQTEAALALGYSPRRAFFRFVLPQAVRTVLPMYRGEMIGLLKSTSIVGYVAINDLTKAGDLVRSRTYEAFFPLLATAFAYFATAWLLAWALDRAGRILDPALRRRRVRRKEEAK